METLDILVPFVWLFILMVIGTIISEVAYKKRSFKDMAGDLHQVLKKCLFYSVWLVAITYVYYKLGIVE